MMSSPHEDLAWVYNKHWGPYASQAIAILDELLLNDFPPKAHILDLCCGTGQLAHELTRKGYQVIGIDSSAMMIRFARENAPDADFILGDARYFDFDHVFDAVISTYDSLNFIMSKKDLATVFRNVYSALKPGGLFIFDLNTETGYLDHWDDGVFDIVEEDHVCLVRLDFDPEERLSRFDTTIFRLLDGWQRSDLTLFQRCHSQQEIRDALEATGFVANRTYGYRDETGLGEFTLESERVYYVCRRRTK